MTTEATVRIGRNPDLTQQGWDMLKNALHHAAPDTGWAFFDQVKDAALGYKTLPDPKGLSTKPEGDRR